MKTQIEKLVLALAMMGLAQSAVSQFLYTTNNGAITITKYTGSSRTVTIPDAINGWLVVSIGPNAFLSSSVTSVTIPNSVNSIGDSAFKFCGYLTNITIPGSVTSIGYAAFYHTGLLCVTIPDSVTTIGDAAFAQCLNVTNVTIPDSVTKIGIEAFGDCMGLTTVTIPDRLTSIGYAAFSGCRNLTAIMVSAQNSVYSSVDGVLFDKSQTTLIEYPYGKGRSYAIPDNVTSIGYAAFYACSSLTNVTIPNRVSSIEDEAFEACSSLTSVTIPGSVTNIGDYAFETCYELTNVTIPKSITHIGYAAFGHCTCLNALYFRGDVPGYSSSVFDGDSNVTVYYLSGTTGWSSTFGILPAVPAVLWNPRVTTFNVTIGHFEFNITGPTNAVIVVEACTNLVNPVWLPVSTNTLGGDGTSSFSDSQSPNHPGRFYRFRSP